MKRKSLPVLFLACALSLVLGSCNKKKCDTLPGGTLEGNGPANGIGNCDDCSATHSAAISSVTGPATVQAGQSAVLTVTLVGGGCSVSGAVHAVTNGRNIALTGIVHDEGCVCTLELKAVPATYTFTPGQAGTYTFSYTDESRQLKTFTIVVQ